MKMTRLFIASIFLFTSFFSGSQNIFEGYEHLFTNVRHYTVYQSETDIIIDGKPDENSWKLADWSEYFIDIEGDRRPKPTYNTRVKMLWDKHYLYILAELEEPHVWAYYVTRDQIVFHENDFEIFIDPDGDTHKYFEFELNAQNTLFDLFMPKPYRNGGHYDIGWDAAGFKSAVHVEGTLNNPADTDKKWTVEMAIPFSALKLADEKVVPEDNDFWKIGFSRVQWQTEVVDGKYQKVKDVNTNKFLSEDNWVWSEQGVINMHYPERWGLALFSKKPVGKAKVDFVYPEREIYGKYLWLIYYKQHKYRSENGRFAVSLTELGLENNITGENGETIILKLETGEKEFKAFLEKVSGIKLSINQEGLFKKNN